MTDKEKLLLKAARELIRSNGLYISNRSEPYYANQACKKWNALVDAVKAYKK